MLFEGFGLGGEADRKRAVIQRRHTGKYVWILRQRQRHAFVAGFLQLVERIFRRPKVSARGGPDIQITAPRHRLMHRIVHLRCTANVDAINARRCAERHRPGHQRDRSTVGNRRTRQGKSHLSRAAVAEKPDGVEIFEGGPC